MRISKKEEIVKGISGAIAEFYNKCFGKWVSVVDFSLTQAMVENKVNKYYATYALKVMKGHGLVELDGERSGMKYRINSKSIDDISLIANEIYELHKKEVREYNKKRKDLQPFRVKKDKEEFNIKTTLVPKKIPYIRDAVYIVYQSSIIEGRVHSITECGEKGITFSVKINHLSEHTDYHVVENIPASRIFSSPEEAASFLVKKAIKFTTIESQALQKTS